MNKVKERSASIETVSHDGRGVARIEGKTTFIEGALPGETVTFRYLRKKRAFDEGALVSILKPSPLRIEPRCPHYFSCGGCALQHLSVEAQREIKERLFLDTLARLGRVEPLTLLPPLGANEWSYRRKARLSVRYVEKKEATLVGFREKNNPRYISDIHHCSVLHERVDAVISQLRAVLDTFETPQSIAQIEVAVGDEDVAFIFRHLLPLSAHDIEKLHAFATSTGIRLFLQPEGIESVHVFHPEEASPFLSYTLPGEAIRFLFHPTDFTQVHLEVNRLMVAQAMHLLALEKKDVVLDLFCGLGNFSLPLAKRVNTVVGIEGTASMVERAKMNASLNQLTNALFFCRNLEEESALFTLKEYAFSKILLDPPRTGAVAVVKQIHRLHPQRIVYVSCNPATLARDAGILVHQQGYRLLAGGIIDMFPHTAHVESIVLFEKG